MTVAHGFSTLNVAYQLIVERRIARGLKLIWAQEPKPCRRFRPTGDDLDMSYGSKNLLGGDLLAGCQTKSGYCHSAPFLAIPLESRRLKSRGRVRVLERQPSQMRHAQRVDHQADVPRGWSGRTGRLGRDSGSTGRDRPFPR